MYGSVRPVEQVAYLVFADISIPASVEGPPRAHRLPLHPYNTRLVYAHISK